MVQQVHTALPSSIKVVVTAGATPPLTVKATLQSHVCWPSQAVPPRQATLTCATSDTQVIAGFKPGGMTDSGPGTHPYNAMPEHTRRHNTC